VRIEPLFKKQPSFLSIHTELRLLAKNHNCGYCGKRMKEVTIDHFWAKSLGGKTKIDNFVACCNDCNQAKANKTVWDFIMSNQNDVVLNLKKYLNGLKGKIIDGIEYTKVMKEKLHNEYGIWV